MNIYSNISQNKWKTWLIMSLFIVFVTTVAFVFGKASGYGLSYAGIALIFAGFTSLGSYFYSDKLVVATTGAKEIKKQDHPELFRIVENLAIGAGMPMPKVYIMHEEAPNAFATGRDPKHGVVCVTTGLLDKLTKAELEGVIAHELSHINNFDTRLMAITAILVGSLALLSDMFMRHLWWGGNNDDNNSSSKGQAIFLVIAIAFAILSPLIATLIQLAVSRKREFLADASGSLLTRYPEGLARALEKIAQDRHPIKSASNATAHLFISNPFKNKSSKEWFSSLFNTHPPLEERIKVLRSM